MSYDVVIIFFTPTYFNTLSNFKTKREWETFFVVFPVFLRTSAEFSHNNIRKFSSIVYDTHVRLGVRDQVHNPNLFIFKFHW